MIPVPRESQPDASPVVSAAELLTAADLFPDTGPMPPRRVLMRDPSLPHQIRLDYATRRGELHRVVVGCNCGLLRRVLADGEDADTALTAYRRHLEEQEVATDG